MPTKCEILSTKARRDCAIICRWLEIMPEWPNENPVFDLFRERLLAGELVEIRTGHSPKFTAHPVKP